MRCYFKSICILLALVLVLSQLLVSCNNQSGKPSSDESNTNGTIEQEPDYDAHLTLAEKNKSDFVIIYPSEPGDITSSAVANLRYAFKSTLGASISVKTDLQIKEEGNSLSREILVGRTNRPESEEAYSSLGDNGYVIKVIKNKLVFAAESDAMLLKATQYFIDNYIKIATDSVKVTRDLYCADSSSSSSAVISNSDGTLTLDLTRFVITYDYSHPYSFIPSLATAFAKRAQNICGAIAITEERNVNKYEILFGKCNRAEFKSAESYLFRDFSIYYENGKLSINAFSIYGYEAAINFLLEGFEKGGLKISKDGFLYEHDYGNEPLASVLKNYENPSLEGAQLVNICHRGDITTNAYPENSLPSYQSCIDNGIDIIETDLRKTKDGVWVILHDSTLDRTTTGHGDLSNYTYEEISQLFLKAQNGGNTAVTEYKIPRLEEVIELCRGKVMLNLDKLDRSTFDEVYAIFESMDAVDSAMFKAGISAGEIGLWFCALVERGQKLPLFSPMIYGEAQLAHDGAPTFMGLTAMVETGNGHTPETLAHILSYGIRTMCLTALTPHLENVTTWSMLADKGYGAIMTDAPIDLENFIKERYK